MQQDQRWAATTREVMQFDAVGGNAANERESRQNQTQEGLAVCLVCGPKGAAARLTSPLQPKVLHALAIRYSCPCSPQ
jgi:hypothetical protein